MAICEICKKEFDKLTAQDEFECGVYSSVSSVSYDQFGRELCGACAIEEYNAGNYYEECERCGKRFYPDSEELSFESQVSHKVSDAMMYEFGILCADCAASALLNSLDDEIE